MRNTLHTLKEMFDAMFEDDFEVAAAKAQELAALLESDGCPTQSEFVTLLTKATKFYKNSDLYEEETYEEVDFDEDINDDDSFFDREELDFDV